jgi:hypothetical protein
LGDVATECKCFFYLFFRRELMRAESFRIPFVTKWMRLMLDRANGDQGGRNGVASRLKSGLTF